MLDIERAFERDDHKIFLRAEQEMPLEMLEDCYKLLWEALASKKFSVGKFLMRKPYFNPLLSTSKPKNWMTLVSSMPDLLQIACENHIIGSRISTHDALVLIKTASRIKFLNKKGLELFITNFQHENLSEQEQYQSFYLLGQLLADGEWYWARELIEWGVPINEIAINQWAKSGFHIKIIGKGKEGKSVWPHPELRQFKRQFVTLMQRMPDSGIKNIVSNNQIDAFLFITKTFQDVSLKNRFVIKTVSISISNPKSELSDFLAGKFPKLVKKIFSPEERWVKLAASNKKPNLSTIEKLLLNENYQQIELYAVTEACLLAVKDPDLIIAAIKSLPKPSATLCLRYKAREIGIDVLVPKISRKEHIEMLLSEDNDPMSLLIFTQKPAHQTFLMDKMASL